MSVTLDATVGGAASNSYLTPTRATELADYRVGGDAWSAQYDADERARRLITATARLDALNYTGTMANQSQALAWPRVGAIGRMGIPLTDTDIPFPIQQATIALALSYPASGSGDSSSGTVDPNIKALKAGDVELEYFAPGVKIAEAPNDTSDLPAEVVRLILSLLALQPATSGWGSSRAVRTS